VSRSIPPPPAAICRIGGLGSHVIDQARRRVLDGEQVPNGEKIYSIFEPHTDLIKRGKVRFQSQAFMRKLVVRHALILHRTSKWS
jgi:hypothetical protein